MNSDAPEYHGRRARGHGQGGYATRFAAMKRYPRFYTGVCLMSEAVCFNTGNFTRFIALPLSVVR